MRFEHWRYVLPLRLRAILRRADVERELDDELRYHVERQTELNLQHGMSPSDARRAAMVAMGGIESHKEACRERRGVDVLENLLRDTRHGLRLLRRSPIFTAVAILSLALGVGANAAILQLIDAVKFRTLPIANPQELAEIRSQFAHDFGVSDDDNSHITYPLWEQMRSHQTAFGSLFAWGNMEFLAGRGTGARKVRGLWTSGDFFTTLGINAERGRLLTANDDHAGCGTGPAIVSHGFWQSSLGGRESAIGSVLMLHGRPFTVVGVTPAQFTGLEIGETFDVAVPLCAAGALGDLPERKDYFWLTVMGRLTPGWTLAQASAQLRAISPAILDLTVPSGYGAELLKQYRGFRFEAIPAGRGVSRLRDAYGTPLWLLLGLTGLVLVITCANLATLLLARASAREREVAVRVALGASRARLVSQMLIESLLLATGGAILAVPIAVMSARALAAFFGSAANPVTLDLTANWRLVAFVGASAFLTALLFGLLPALRVSIVDPLAAMRQSARGASVDRHRARFQRLLVIGQIAVSLVLIVSALAFAQTLRNLAAVHTGFERHNVIGVSFTDLTPRPGPLEQRVAFQDQLAREIRSVPGVTAAASTTHLPLSPSTWSHFFRMTDAPEREQKPSRFIYVDPGYFDTLGIPIRAGRDFTGIDTARSRRVLIVNESFVRSHLGARPAIGATLRTVAEPGYPETTYEIVGVAGNTKYSTLRDENCWCERPSDTMAPIAFVPMAQSPELRPWQGVIARTEAPISAVTASIAQRVARLNPGIAVQFTEFDSQLRDHLATERMMAWLAGAFGAVAVVLVIVGLYGIIAYLAASRRNEIGIRLSLGSTRAQIIRLVLRDCVRLLAFGLMLGLPLAAVALRGASTLLFGLSPLDLLTMAGAAGLLAAAVGLAASVPAWQAARVDPNVAIRCE